MAWTTADRDKIKAAVLELATGTREVSVTIGDHTTTFALTDLDTLRALLAEAEADVAITADTTRPRRWLLYGSSGT